jgi:abequosyltransferase
MVKTNNLLSIAIPVYNFESFLPGCLESLLDESFELNVEVLVFDGCSTDKTQLVVGAYQQKYPNLRYVKALNKGGIDFDMTKSVELVSSRYCWLFSGDDIVRPQSIKTIISTIEKCDPDLILCRHNECQYDMSIIKDWPILDIKEDRVFQLDDEQERLEYLSLALTSEAFFSFMGGLIIKRETWFREQLNPDLDGSCWAHIGRLWSLTKYPFKLYYMHEVALDRRGGNDSFSNDGMLNRLRIQISGLINAIETVFEKDSVAVQNLKRVIKGEVYPDWAGAVKANLTAIHAPQEQHDELDTLLKKINQ